MTVVKDLVITGTIGAVTGPIIVDGASNVSKEANRSRVHTAIRLVLH